MIVLLAIGVVGFAGYTVWQSQKATDTTTNTGSAPKHQQTADLTTVDNSLQNADTSLGRDLETGSLEADLADLL